MNINQLSKMFNDMNTQEVRTLELKVGQVVRGVVTQHLPNQEALVNINGVQVKAKLEVAILEGQATLMQVAADSKGSFIHLKQVDPTTLGLQDPMKDILRAMQLPDKDWSAQLIRELRQEGFPLNRETLQAFAQAAKLVPANVDLENWMQAAAMAFKRGMPMTLSSISAMHQLSQGLPLHQLINQLQQQLTSLFQSQGQAINPQVAQQLQQFSQSLNALVSGPFQQTSQPQGQLDITTAATQNATQQASLNVQGQPIPAAPLSNMQNPIASFMKLLGVQHENMLSQQLYAKSDGLATTGQNQTQQGTILNQTISSAVTQIQQGSTIPVQQQNTAPFTAMSQQMVSNQANQANVNSANGLGHSSSTVQQQATNQASTMITNVQAQQANTAVAAHATHAGQQQEAVMQQPTPPVQNQAATQTTTAQQPQANSMQQQPVSINNQQIAMPHMQAEVELGQFQGAAQQANAGLNQATETIKATVMQLLQIPELNTSVKETMTQLLNHITGQQMMLSTERNHSMFTHVTMYIPIKDDQGGQTAAIHVQTRRDRKGQLDADNCRIVFDLNMKQLGQTLVDMNVTNKIVSLNIWNDSSFIQSLIESMRPEIFEAMQNTGYSLSSIRTTPFKKEEDKQEAEVKAIVHPPDLQHMQATRYKGVDLKV